MNTSWRGVQKHFKPYKHSKDSVENVYKMQQQITFKKVSKNTPNLPNTQKTILNNPKNWAPKHLMFLGVPKALQTSQILQSVPWLIKSKQVQHITF